MFKKIKEFFTGKPAVVETTVAAVPYKVEVPPVAEVATTPVAEVATTPVAEVVPAKKKPAVKKTPAAKKPRAPRKPK